MDNMDNKEPYPPGENLSEIKRLIDLAKQTYFNAATLPIGDYQLPDQPNQELTVEAEIFPGPIGIYFCSRDKEGKNTTINFPGLITSDSNIPRIPNVAEDQADAWRIEIDLKKGDGVAEDILCRIIEFTDTRISKFEVTARTSKSDIKLLPMNTHDYEFIGFFLQECSRFIEQVLEKK